MIEVKTNKGVLEECNAMGQMSEILADISTIIWNLYKMVDEKDKETGKVFKEVFIERVNSDDFWE